MGRGIQRIRDRPRRRLSFALHLVEEGPLQSRLQLSRTAKRHRKVAKIYGMLSGRSHHNTVSRQRLKSRDQRGNMVRLTVKEVLALWVHNRASLFPLVRVFPLESDVCELIGF